MNYKRKIHITKGVNMNNDLVEFRAQSFSIQPYEDEDGSFSLKNHRQKFKVTNISAYGYKIFLANNPNTYNIQAIPINEIECMVCDNRVSPEYFHIK